MAVALPHKRGVRSAVLVAMAQSLGELERIRARSDHQRREGVPQVVKSETLEIASAARLDRSSGSLDRLGEHVGAEASG